MTKPIYSLLLLTAIFLIGCQPETVRITAEPVSVSAALATVEPPLALERVTVTQIPTVTLTPAVAQVAPTETPTPLPPTPTERPTQLPPPPTAGPEATPALPPLPAILPTPIVTTTVRVPILMYHYVSEPPEDADNYRINLSVTPDDFREQMAFIRSLGYETVDMYDVMEALLTQKELPEKAIILTFDDGYVDNYEFAYPILEEFGFEGTFFIPTEFIDFGYDGYMTWEMIREMAADGHRFESHSKTHTDLAVAERSELVYQILGSQETLAFHLGYKPQFLSYPSGRYDEDTIQLAQELNIWAAVTTKPGVWRGYEDRFEWGRTRVSNNTSLFDLEKILVPQPEG